VVERGIGRGLAAILPPSETREESLIRIPVDTVRPNPRQPRVSLEDESLQQLADSIRVHGVLQPVLVRPLPGGAYELIAGERRWRAACLAGLDTVPAVLRESEESERLELALIENMAREDLNPVDAARACAALVEELGLTKEDVGRRVGRSRVAISNLVRLLDLPDQVLVMLQDGELTEGHGRALLQAPGPNAQRDLAREARERRLSVRETEARARSAASGDRVTAPAAPLSLAGDPDAERAREEAEDVLASALGAEVRVRFRRAGCTVEIPLDDLQDVHRIAARLSGRMAA
jgi:ParB family chromosome partitioning protein